MPRPLRNGVLAIAAAAAFAVTPAVPSVISRSHDDPAPPSGTNDARKRFDDAMHAERARHRDQLAAIRGAYSSHLADARRHALERGDVDSAQRLLMAQDSLESAESDAAALDAGFAVIAARWGAGAQWGDVTNHVRESIKEGSLRIVPQYAKFPDPKFGTNKSLLVVYAVDGDIDVAIVGHDQLLTLPPAR